MVKRIFVSDARGQGEFVEEGERLVKKLEEKNFPITAAFWRVSEEENHLRLVIVSPFVGREGPLETYAYIRKAVEELGSSVHFGLGDISVMSPLGSQFTDLRRALQGSGIKEFTATEAAAPSRWLESDSFTLYLYRWNPDLINAA